MRRLFGLLLSLATLWLLVMTALSWSFYTSYGVDLETHEGDRVRCSYYRVRWPGNGGIWFGGGAHYRRTTSKPFVSFDPAASAFHDVRWHRVPEPITFWNRLGFWWIVDSPTDPSNPHPVPRLLWGFWLGVPAWLPVLVALLWLARYCGVRRDRANSTPSTCHG